MNTGSTNWKAVRDQINSKLINQPSSPHSVMIAGRDNCRRALGVIDSVYRTGTKTGERK